VSDTRNSSTVAACALWNKKAGRGHWLRPFFFVEPTLTGINYLDMLQWWLMPQLQGDIEGFISQQDRAPPHFHFDSAKKIGGKFIVYVVSCPI
jgi:hypothetical protein